MKKKSTQPLNFPDGELQCFVGTREVGKRAGNKNHSYNLSPTKRLSDILLVRRFIRGAAAQKKDEKENDHLDLGVLDRRTAPRFSDGNHRFVGQSASSMSSASTNRDLRTNSSSLLMSTNSSSISGSGGYFSGGGMGVGGRYGRRNSSVRSGRSCASAKSNATALTAVSSLAGSSSICSSASAAAAYKKGKLRRFSRYDDEISENGGQLGINEKELNSMNKHIPALKSHGKSATFRQHYYPEGGWGWVITFCCYMVNIFTTGLQMSFGIILPEIVSHCQKSEQTPSTTRVDVVWIGATNLAVSYLLSPLLVSICRRKSTRLTAVIGGLVMSLSLLFASFAKHYHQIFLSYGILFGVGCAMVRETSTLMLSQYFKRRREIVEMIASTGTGFGIAIFSNVFRSGMRSLGFRPGLQMVTAALSSLFFLGLFYRSASLYHPQRRAILHLKDMSKRKGKDKAKIENKPPYFDLTTLKAKPFHIILLATAFAAFGAYTPLFFFVPVSLDEGLKDDAVLLQTFLGIATSVGSLSYGLIVLSKNNQCMISRQYLLQSSVLGIGISMLALASVEGYHGYLLFSWMYGVFLGGFEFSLKTYTLERVRVRQFPRGWGFVQGAKAIPALLGIPIASYISEATSNPKAGLYFSVATCFASVVVLFFVDSLKTSSDYISYGVPQPYGHENRGDLCKTDTNLTFELLGGGNAGDVVPDSASIDSAGALQLMMMRNGGSRLQRQMSFFQMSNSVGNSSLRRKQSDSLIMKPFSNSQAENNAFIDPCNAADGSLKCICDTENEPTNARKISILSNHSHVLMENTMPARKKSSTGSNSSKHLTEASYPQDVYNDDATNQSGGTYVEKNGIYEELSEADAMESVCRDINDVMIGEMDDVNDAVFLGHDDSDTDGKIKIDVGQVHRKQDEFIKLKTASRISMNHGHHSTLDDEVEEGGDILIDEDLLVEAAEEEPELLSCTLIDIPMDVFDNNDPLIADSDIAAQQGVSLSCAENGRRINGEFLGMINEEDEELGSPDELKSVGYLYGVQNRFQCSHILNKRNSASHLINKNLSLSEPEINHIDKNNDKTSKPIKEPLSVNEVKVGTQNVGKITGLMKSEYGVSTIKNDKDNMMSDLENGEILSATTNKCNYLASASNGSSTSNVANNNAFHAVTTRAEVTSYV